MRKAPAVLLLSVLAVPALSALPVISAPHAERPPGGTRTSGRPPCTGVDRTRARLGRRTCACVSAWRARRSGPA